MGFVAKANTRKLVAPRQFVTSLDVVTATGAIHELVEGVPEKVGILTRGHRYYSFYDVEWTRLVVSYGAPNKKTGVVNHFWKLGHQAKAASGSSLLLTFAPVSWTTHDDSFDYQGELKWLMRSVTERLQQRDPGFRSVEA